MKVGNTDGVDPDCKDCCGRTPLSLAIGSEEGLPQLLELIRKTALETSVQFKWIVSSQNRPDIKQQFTFDNSRMRLGLELNANSVVMIYGKVFPRTFLDR